MEFSPKKWKCQDGHEHLVIEVTFAREDIEIAEGIAKAKVTHVNVHAPNGKSRSPADIFNRIVAGKLADAAVAELLRRRIQKFERAYTIHEYDHERDDDFTDPDPYDLLLSKESTHEKIEVRSSFSYRLAPVENIIRKMSVYGWYTSANKPLEEEKDWYWQVVYYYYPNAETKATSQSTVRVEVFEEALKQRKVVGYVVGGASRNLLQKNGKARKDDQEDATYQAISPICGAFDYYKMIEAMLGMKVV